MILTVKVKTKKSVHTSAMASLITEHVELFHVPKRGEVMTGSILEKTSNALYIDLGQFGVGIVYGKELFDGLDTFEHSVIGDTCQATVEGVDNEDGYVELSLRSATRERSWSELQRKCDEQTAFQTEIIDANRGGLIVRVAGITGFLPVSQLAPDHYPRVEGGNKNKILDRLKLYVGQMFTVKVINIDQTEEKLIVSEKSAVSDEISSTLAMLGEGKIIEGVVSGVVDFGVFVKFIENGKELEGLVHISELAWQRIDDPADIVSVGEMVKAKVVGVDDGLRISLSLKQLQEDPWVKVAERYVVGEKIKGEILKVTPFGGFVKLDNEIHGLVHLSELPDDAKKSSSDYLKVGEFSEFTIISIEPKDHRLGLSLRTQIVDEGTDRTLEKNRRVLKKSVTISGAAKKERTKKTKKLDT